MKPKFETFVSGIGLVAFGFLMAILYMWHLEKTECLGRPHNWTQWAVSSEITATGRDPDSRLRLNDAKVEERHCLQCGKNQLHLVEIIR